MPGLALPFRFAHSQRVLRPFVRKGWGHWLRLTVLLGAGMYAGHLLEDNPWTTDLKFAIYQRQMNLLHTGNIYPRRTALVLVDDEDYYGELFQRRSPINRAALAKLLTRLDEVGVSTIVVDFDLRSPRSDRPGYELPDYRAEDKVLIDTMATICSHGRHLVLTSALKDAPDGRYFVVPSIYTTSLERLPCVSSGYLQFPHDLRTVPGPVEVSGGGKVDSLSLAVVKIADPSAYAEATRDENQTFRFGRFLSSADYAERNGQKFIFSGGDLLRMQTAYLQTQLATRIVFVSGHWSDRAYHSGFFVDMHASPGGQVTGAMLHANYVEALLDRTGTFNHITDHGAEFLESLLVIVLALISAFEIHAVWKWAAFAAGLIFSVLLTYVLLQNLGLFLDFFVPLLMIVVHTAVEEIICMRAELTHAHHLLREHHA